MAATQPNEPLAFSRGQGLGGTGGAGYLGAAITAELDAQFAKMGCFDLLGRAEALICEHTPSHTAPRRQLHHASGMLLSQCHKMN